MQRYVFFSAHPRGMKVLFSKNYSFRGILLQYRDERGRNAGEMLAETAEK